MELDRAMAYELKSRNQFGLALMSPLSTHKTTAYAQIITAIMIIITWSKYP